MNLQDLYERHLHWLNDHPQAMLWAARVAVVMAAWQFVKVVRLYTLIETEVAKRYSDAARAASEALGG